MSKPVFQFYSIVPKSNFEDNGFKVEFFTDNKKIVKCQILEMEDYDDGFLNGYTKNRYYGKAICDDSDTFSLEIGIRLAFLRAMAHRKIKQEKIIKRTKAEIEKNIVKFEKILETSFKSKLNTKIKKGRIK